MGKENFTQGEELEYGVIVYDKALIRRQTLN